MQKKTLLFAGIILCLLFLAAGFYLYQKPRAGLADTKPDYSLTAGELYTAFDQNEQKANRKFVGKVIRVKGTADNVQAADSSINILLAGNGEMGGINCSIAKGGTTLSALPAKGTVIRVKGRCVGFLMDVNLVDAVIEK